MGSSRYRPHGRVELAVLLKGLQVAGCSFLLNTFVLAPIWKMRTSIPAHSVRFFGGGKGASANARVKIGHPSHPIACMTRTAELWNASLFASKVCLCWLLVDWEPRDMRGGGCVGFRSKIMGFLFFFPSLLTTHTHSLSLSLGAMIVCLSSKSWVSGGGGAGREGTWAGHFGSRKGAYVTRSSSPES